MSRNTKEESATAAAPIGAAIPQAAIALAAYNGKKKNRKNMIRIPNHIKWIALICATALLPVLLTIFPAFLHLADIIPWPSRPESHPHLYEQIGANPPPNGYVWSYGNTAQSLYRLPLNSLPSIDLKNAPPADKAQRATFARWWSAPTEGSRIFIIEERGRRYEMIWDSEAKSVFLSNSSTTPTKAHSPC